MTWVKILPTDDIVIKCIYDTTDRTETTAAGFRTGDEMCQINIGFLGASEISDRRIIHCISEAKTSIEEVSIITLFFYIRQLFSKCEQFFRHLNCCFFLEGINF